MADTTMDRLRAALNLPIEFETVFVDDRTVVIQGKVIEPLPEFGTVRQSKRPYIFGARR